MQSQWLIQDLMIFHRPMAFKRLNRFSQTHHYDAVLRLRCC